MERNVKIRQDGGQTTEHVVNAVTYGELKSELQMNFEGKKVIIRETRLTLEDPAAHLPLTDFTLFVYPLKVKSGADYSRKSYHELRRLCSERKLAQVVGSNGLFNGNYGTNVEMIAKLEKADKKATKATSAPVAKSTPATSSTQEVTAKSEVIAEIQAIQDRLENLKVTVSNLSEVTIQEEVDTLANEFEAIREILVPFGVR